MNVVQNEEPAVHDIRPDIDENVVKTVNDIFEAVIKLNALDDIFEDLTNRLVTHLKDNSLLEYSLELNDEQKLHLIQAVKSKGHEVVDNYIANLVSDDRTKVIYGHVREKTALIAEAVLSSIGQEINRGAIINCRAVQANSKSKDYDEILVRKSKFAGDITIPTDCILISTNCVEVIKASCRGEDAEPDENDTEQSLDL